MRVWDLRTSVLIAAGWLLCITFLGMWRGASFASDESVAFGALQPFAASGPADAEAPKHTKLPIRWAHQRWGAA
jgi:hypothetical protein